MEFQGSFLYFEQNFYKLMDYVPALGFQEVLVVMAGNWYRRRLPSFWAAGNSQSSGFF